MVPMTQGTGQPAEGHVSPAHAGMVPLCGYDDASTATSSPPPTRDGPEKRQLKSRELVSPPPTAGMVRTCARHVGTEDRVSPAHAGMVVGSIEQREACAMSPPPTRGWSRAVDGMRTVNPRGLPRPRGDGPH